MHLSMLSPRVVGGRLLAEFDSESLPQSRDFDLPAILEDRQNLKISHHTIIPRSHQELSISDHFSAFLLANFFQTLYIFFFHFSAFLLANSDDGRKKCERICFILP